MSPAGGSAQDVREKTYERYEKFYDLVDSDSSEEKDTEKKYPASQVILRSEDDEDTALESSKGVAEEDTDS